MPQNGGMWKFWRRRSEAAPDTPRQLEPGPAAERFWHSWSTVLPKVSAALGEGELAGLENELCELVAAVHPDLHFAIERGQQAIYALVVTGQGDPELRPYTDAWMAAAPPLSPIWEYYDAVPPVPDPTEVTVNLGTHRIPLADVRVVAQVDAPAGLVDVAVYHPKMAELDKPAQDAITFLPLDATLGERLAADRLGRVETAEHEPANAIGLLEFRDLVRDLDADTPAAETTPDATTSADTKAADTKAADTKAADTKSADAATDPAEEPPTNPTADTDPVDHPE